MIRKAKGFRRWSDNDQHFGPFTYARERRGGYRPFNISLRSGEEEYAGCHLLLQAFGRTLLVELPAIIKPHREKVFVKSWSAETIERLGRDWYWQEDPREYGFSINEGHLNVSLGRQTHDSSTTKRWGKFLPWTQWRFIRHSLYDTDGKHFWTEQNRRDWNAFHVAKETCPSVSFEFDDFDGERIVACTTIEEREWKFGEGWFKWLSWFRRPKISRSLDLQFSAETGKRKGSWKGGTVGHSIEMLPGELHEAAFRRYCPTRGMTFVGLLPAGDA